MVPQLTCVGGVVKNWVMKKEVVKFVCMFPTNPIASCGDPS